MKSEDFFSLILREVLGVSATEVDKHFRDFRRSHRRFPQIAGSLEREVVDSAGNIMADDDIFQLIEELKQRRVDSPREFWESLVQSQVLYAVSLSDLYLQEIRTQLRFAIMCYDNYLIAKNEADIDRIFLHIHHFLIHVANVDKLVDKLLNPSENLIAELMSQIVDLSDIELKSFRAARNHLEHFEERLDAWFYLYAGSPVFDMNVANARTTGLPEERCLRLLRTDENLFVILGERFDLDDLYRQVCLFAERTKAFSEDEIDRQEHQ